MKIKILVVFLLLIGQVNAELLIGRVTRVIDGDTLVVNSEKVRLVAIDAPELKQRHGREAKKALDVFRSKKVTVEYYKRGPYKRIIGKVFYDGWDIGLHQIASGNAWYASRYSKDLYGTNDALHYETAHKTAKNLQRGLWAYDNPVAPWKYRRRK